MKRMMIGSLAHRTGLFLAQASPKLRDAPRGEQIAAFIDQDHGETDVADAPGILRELAWWQNTVGLWRGAIADEREKYKRHHDAEGRCRTLEQVLDSMPDDLYEAAVAWLTEQGGYTIETEADAETPEASLPPLQTPDA